MRIAFLYTELADYTIACLRAVKDKRPGVEILVVHFPVNPEAPFQFDFSGIGEFVCIKDFATYDDFKKKIAAFAPQKIVCCGWVNKWYIRFCAAYRTRAQCILAADNHWRNSTKQQLLRVAGRFFLTRVFDKIWVPGAPQLNFAQKIGFTTGRILTGFYCCDIERFNAFYEQHKAEKHQHFPRRLLCVARYIPAKNYQLLWNSFIAWNTRQGGQWELWCAGTGEQFDQRVQHPAIRHLGFVQKKDWDEVVRQTGVFILPSLSEPWAVAVHEFAAAGYPLLLSNRVGAATQFLTEANGFSFDPYSQEDMEQCFDNISTLTPEQLTNMSAASHQLAQVIVPDTWAATLLDA